MGHHYAVVDVSGALDKGFNTRRHSAVGNFRYQRTQLLSMLKRMLQQKPVVLFLSALSQLMKAAMLGKAMHGESEGLS
jgi:hypothetical protein